MLPTADPKRQAAAQWVGQMRLIHRRGSRESDHGTVDGLDVFG